MKFGIWVSDYRNFELLDLRTIGPSDYRTVTRTSQPINLVGISQYIKIIFNSRFDVFDTICLPPHPQKKTKKTTNKQNQITWFT
jgi:hypothetical protein